MDEDEAVEALDALGLSTYEARVFIGLQKLGVGGASAVAEVTDVPRSQVYGAADALAEYGLVDVEQGSPTRYRPVAIEEARERLTERLERRAAGAFEYIEEVRGDHADAEAASEAIWTVTGAETISARVASLVEDADRRLVYGTSDVGHLEEPVAGALAAAADRGVDVVVASEAPAVEAQVDTLPAAVAFQRVPEQRRSELSTGRVLVCDGDTLLLSVEPTAGLTEVSAETAFWSSEGAFATVLVTLIEERLEELLASYADE